jgi:hypothetical protein
LIQGLGAFHSPNPLRVQLPIWIQRVIEIQAVVARSKSERRDYNWHVVGTEEPKMSEEGKIHVGGEFRRDHVQVFVKM